MEWSGVEWGGVEWSGMEWNGMEQPTDPAGLLLKVYRYVQLQKYRMHATFTYS